MKTLLLSVIVIAAAVPVPALQADPIVVLPAGALWNYTFSDPTSDPTWNTTTGTAVGWNTGAAPFGNCPMAAGCESYTREFDAATYWPADSTFKDDLWIRTSIDVPPSLTDSLVWSLGVDNGFKLYLNGILIAADYAEGYTWRWEYSGKIPSELLVHGPQVIALALNDTGALTAFDMQITNGSPVPEPASLFLVATGLAALARRRTASENLGE